MNCEVCVGLSADGLLSDAHVYVYTCIRVCVTESTVRCAVCDKGLLGERLCTGVLHITLRTVAPPAGGGGGCIRFSCDFHVPALVRQVWLGYYKTPSDSSTQEHAASEPPVSRIARCAQRCYALIKRPVAKGIAWIGEEGFVPCHWRRGFVRALIKKSCWSTPGHYKNNASPEAQSSIGRVQHPQARQSEACACHGLSLAGALQRMSMAKRS